MTVYRCRRRSVNEQGEQQAAKSAPVDCGSGTQWESGPVDQGPYINTVRPCRSKAEATRGEFFGWSRGLVSAVGSAGVNFTLVPGSSRAELASSSLQILH